MSIALYKILNSAIFYDGCEKFDRAKINRQPVLGILVLLKRKFVSKFLPSKFQNYTVILTNQ